MLFLTFHSQEERRSYGGSSFIELQFCMKPSGTSVREIMDADSIAHWKGDSLYVNDENTFYREYRDILGYGIYHNLQSGPVDLYGVNYYGSSAIDPIMNRLDKEKPAEYRVFSKWLDRAKRYNGFYILGF